MSAPALAPALGGDFYRSEAGVHQTLTNRDVVKTETQCVTGKLQKQLDSCQYVSGCRKKSLYLSRLNPLILLGWLLAVCSFLLLNYLRIIKISPVPPGIWSKEHRKFHVNKRINER